MAVESHWCRVCGTRHASGSACPGPLPATGDERAGWRVTVETFDGVDAIGVLVAPSGELWRARILTYPNVLWTIPGGGGAMKFVAASPREAEALAIAFLERHCLERGWKRRDAVKPVDLGSLPPDAGSTHPSAPSPARRRLRSFPVRFGSARPSTDAVTGNLSETGLFISTHEPLAPGTQIRMRLDLESAQVALRGLVVWNRERFVLGRPAGMGIRLLDPPAVYVGYVQGLR